MKNKLLLPVMAVALAVLSAFSTAPVSQMGWYDSNGLNENGGQYTSITNPAGDEPACSVNAEDHLCIIQVGTQQHIAFNSKTNAETGGGQGTNGRLRYDDPE